MLKESNQDTHWHYGKLKWKGHTTRAVDGTSLLIPHSEDLLKHFKQKKTNSGGKTHYPMASLITATNVFTGQVGATRVNSFMGISERDQLLSMLNEFNKGDLCLLDRGFWGLRVFHNFDKMGQNYLCRIPTGSKAPHYIHNFLSKGSKAGIVIQTYLDENKEEHEVKIKLIRGPINKKGQVIVFATNLIQQRYTAQSIIELYRSRWSIETMYGHLKNLFNIENFHSKSYNGVMQEIYANLLLINLIALVVQGAIEYKSINPKNKVPNFKNVSEVVRRHLHYAIMKCKSEYQCRQVAKSMILQSSQILWKKQPGRSTTRVSKKPINRWSFAKAKRMEGTLYR